MADDIDIKSFFDYTEDDLKQTLDKGVYQLKITSAEAGRKDNGNPTLDTRCVVAGGEFAGRFGPIKSWEFGDVSGTRNSDGSEFHIPAKDNRLNLIRDVRAILDGDELVLSSPDTYDEVMMAEIARQIAGREFFAAVAPSASGWDRMGKISPLSDPPKGVVSAELAAEFEF